MVFAFVLRSLCRKLLLAARKELKVLAYAHGSRLRLRREGATITPRVMAAGCKKTGLPFIDAFWNLVGTFASPHHEVMNEGTDKLVRQGDMPLFVADCKVVAKVGSWAILGDGNAGDDFFVAFQPRLNVLHI